MKENIDILKRPRGKGGITMFETHGSKFSMKQVPAFLLFLLAAVFTICPTVVFLMHTGQLVTVIILIIATIITFVILNCFKSFREKYHIIDKIALIILLYDVFLNILLMLFLFKI